jgi:hypothetical protein
MIAMKRFRWISAALLAGMAIFGSASAQAALVLTIQQGATTATATADTTTGMITTSSGPGTFFVDKDAITGETTLAYKGTLNGVVFNLTTAATTNTPGTPTMAMLNLSSSTISNTNTIAKSFTISTSADGYTAPTGSATVPVALDYANGGVLTNGSISGGTFDASADGVNATQQTFSGTGAAVALANNPPTTILFSFPSSTPYTMTSSITATLGASSSTASLGGTVSISAVPEPSSVMTALTGVGLVGLGAVRRKYRTRA